MIGTFAIDSGVVMSFKRMGASALRWVLWSAVATVAALLSACVSAPAAKLSPGQTEADMLAVMGQPTNRYAMAGGVQRVEYAKGPNGKVTWMIDLDTSGRVKSVEQVLTPQHFSRVRNGMSTQDLLHLLGRPSDKAREFRGRESWSWRYENNDCLWARVTVADGRVIGGASMMFDPQCERSY
jgi:hypothetical protein